MPDLKIIFMGTPEFSVPILKALVENYHVVAVVTQPDKLVGRNQELSYSAVKKFALASDIPVLQPVKIRNEWEDALNYQPDLIITCAYGQIIPTEILNYPKLGCINVHASLLPKLRGGAPIHRAIIEGYQITGITIMFMDEKMDTGDIISQAELAITENDNAGTLHDKLSLLGAQEFKSVAKYY
jgi:methionyl-tRNA formyltransferase